jgi:hypothetical protein
MKKLSMLFSLSIFTISIICVSQTSLFASGYGSYSQKTVEGPKTVQVEASLLLQAADALEESSPALAAQLKALAHQVS